MFKKPKKNKNLRRGEVSFGDQNDQEENQDQSEVVVKPQKSTLLSFGDEDEENEVFQVKKSSLSRKLKKERKKKSQKSSKYEEIIGKNSPSPLPSGSLQSSRNEIEIRSDDGLSIRLKKSHQEGKVEEVEDLTMEEEDEESDSKFPSSHNFVSQSFRQGIIPDAAAIHAARKSRQRAREQGDFIALSSKKDEPKEEKQIFSEEEHDSAEEYENMLSLRSEKNNKREDFKTITIDESDEFEMNEDWESQQVRKVVTSAKLNSLNNLPYSIVPSSQNLFTKIKPESPKLTTSQLLEQAYANKKFENPSQKLRENDKTKSVGIRSPQDILKILKEKEESVRDQNTKNILELDDIAKEIEEMEQMALNSENNKPISMKNFAFYQEIKNYSEDLIECMNEKYGNLLELEEKSMNLLSKSSEKLIERRRQDFRDQFEEISERSKKTITENSVDSKRFRRSTEREGRRMRRRKNREKLNIYEVHYEGMSSDEEIPDMELNDFNNNCAQIEDEISKFFDDTCDEFCDLNLILRRFIDWKRKDLKSYKEAYVHLCLPKIVGIFARLQIVLWNPLEQGFSHEKLEWFHPAMMYSANPRETVEGLKNDADVYLVPTVVEKTVIAKLAQMIEKFWDPLSTKQTIKLVRLLMQMSDDYPSLRLTSRNLQAVFQAITIKIKDAIKDDIFIPLLHKFTDGQFYDRQFHSAVKLFRNTVSFQGILNDNILKELAISSLFNRYLQPALNMYLIKDRVAKTNLIISTLPKRSNFEISDILITYMKTLQTQMEMQDATSNNILK